MKARMVKRPYNNLTGYRFEHFDLSSPFYEETSSDLGEEYQVEIPPGWSLSQDETWKYCLPNECELPLQGWKIHLSSCKGKESELLDLVLPITARPACGVVVKRSRSSVGEMPFGASPTHLYYPANGLKGCPLQLKSPNCCGFSIQGEL